MTTADKIFTTLLKNSGSYSTIEDVENTLKVIINNFSVNMSVEQIKIIAQKFFDKYCEITEDLDNLFEEPEDEVEVIKKKIEAYKVKLSKNPENRISIMSMISKLRKKLRNLGVEVETVRNSKTEPTEEAIRAKIEQLELDLALAPVQKRKSVQSMISKLRKKLRDMGVEEVVEKTAKTVKLTPAQKIGLDENQFDNAVENATFNSSNPINKNLLLFLVYYTRKVQPTVTLEDLCKFILKYRKNNFTDKLTEIENHDLSTDDYFDITYSVVETIITTTLKNVIKGEKSTATLSLNVLNTLDLNNLDSKDLKKIAKCSTLKQAQAIIAKSSIDA